MVMGIVAELATSWIHTFSIFVVKTVFVLKSSPFIVYVLLWCARNDSVELLHWLVLN